MTNKNEMVTFNSEKNKRALSTALNVFNPIMIDNITDAKTMLLTVNAVNDRLDFASYKLLHKVYITDMWKTDIITKGKETRAPKTFEEWAKVCVNLEKSQAYNAVKCGEYIKDDGTGTTLPHPKTLKDFTFTHLVKILECKELYETHTEKDENGKTIKTKTLKVVKEYKQRTDENGRIIATFDNGQYVEHYEATGNHITLLEMLCNISYISPLLSVKKCVDRIKQYDYTDENGVHMLGETELQKPDNVDTDNTDTETEETYENGVKEESETKENIFNSLLKYAESVLQKIVCKEYETAYEILMEMMEILREKAD